MGACCGISISEAGRCRLATALAVLNFLCITTGLGLLSFGVYIKVKIEDHLFLIEEYNADIVPYFFISIGSFMVLLNITGGKILLDCSNIRLRDNARKCLLPYQIVTVVVSLAVLVGMFLCFFTIQKLEDTFEIGVEKALLAYKQGGEIKKEVDELQMEYRCCGGDSFADWFKTPWVSQEYLDISDPNIKAKMVSGNYLNDDVPFSCCDPYTARPCIHHHVQENSMHYKYTYPQDMTLYERGCTGALMNYYSDIILMNVAFFSIGVFLMEILLVLLTRFLQTSIDEAYDIDDKEATTVGFICKCGADDTSDIDQKEPLLRGEIPSKISMNDPKCHSVASIKSGQVVGWNSRQSIKAASEHIYDEPAEIRPAPPAPPTPPASSPPRSIGGSGQSIASSYLQPSSSPQKSSHKSVARKQSSNRSQGVRMSQDQVYDYPTRASVSKKDSLDWE